MLSRVTFNSNFDQMVYQLQAVSSRYSRAMEVASSGKKIGAPSDGASAYSRILQKRDDLGRVENHQNAARRAAGELGRADSVLSTVYDELTRARELAVQGSSETYADEDLVALADEIAGIRDSVLQRSNERFEGRYLFAGQKTDGPAFGEDGVYLGDDGIRKVIVGDNYKLDVNIPGDEIFVADGGVDVFGTLDALESALRSADRDAVQGSLDALDQALTQVNDARVRLGARWNQASNLDFFYEEQKVAITDELSNIEDADATTAYTDLAHISTSMKATLQVASNLSRLSLLDYL